MDNIVHYTTIYFKFNLHTMYMARTEVGCVPLHIMLNAAITGLLQHMTTLEWYSIYPIVDPTLLRSRVRSKWVKTVRDDFKIFI